MISVISADENGYPWNPILINPLELVSIGPKEQRFACCTATMLNGQKFHLWEHPGDIYKRIDAWLEKYGPLYKKEVKDDKG
jgi:hypothetical protein